MDISRQFINNPTRVWLAILLLGVGGLFALLNIGRLEDPAFTIKTAVIVTHYPGASAQQVEEEVTLPLENAIQQLPSLDNVSSISSNGLSQITVNIASQYHSSELPQIWDELRRRVGDASRLFPPGVVPPFVNDDFGDVFGFFFAISGDSFTNPELVRYAEQLRRELVLVPGVGKVAIGGVIPQQINVDISLAKMAARGITLNQLAAILARLNVVSSAGEIRVGSESIRLHPTGEFQSIDELGDLLVSPHGASATTRLRDIATLSRGLTDSPASIYHANGRQAVTMGVSFIPGVNVIDVGHALEARLQQMAADKPAGIDIAIFYDQAAEVGQWLYYQFSDGPGDCRRRAAGIYGGAQRDYYCSVAGAQRSRHPAYHVYLGDRTTTDLPRSAYHRPEYVGGQCHCDCRRGAHRPSARLSAAGRD